MQVSGETVEVSYFFFNINRRKQYICHVIARICACECSSPNCNCRITILIPKYENELDTNTLAFFHLFLCFPASRRPRGWYRRDSSCSQLQFILGRLSSELLWHNFMSSMEFFSFIVLRMLAFLWWSSLVSHKNGLRNLYKVHHLYNRIAFCKLLILNKYQIQMWLYVHF